MNDNRQYQLDLGVADGQKKAGPGDGSGDENIEPTPATIISPVTPSVEIVPARGWSYARTLAEPLKKTNRYEMWAEMLTFPKDVPIVQISWTALIKIHAMLSAIELEVGWLGTAKRHGGNILLDDVFLFKQDVSAGHTKMDPANLNEAMLEVLQLPGGEEIFNNTRFWGHSHGNGMPEPSGQDNDQMKVFRKFGADFFLRGIFSRRGEVNFGVYDWERGYAFHRVGWELIGEKPSDEEFQRLWLLIREEMKEKVTYLPPPPFNYKQYLNIKSWIQNPVPGRTRRRRK